MFQNLSFRYFFQVNKGYASLEINLRMFLQYNAGVKVRDLRSLCIIADIFFVCKINWLRVLVQLLTENDKQMQSFMD
jgi:hypothetical protein